MVSERPAIADQSSAVSVDQPSRSGYCRDFVIQFVENQSAKFSLPPLDGLDEGEIVEPEHSMDEKKEDAREVTAVFKCNGGGFSIPSITSVHFIEEEKDGSTCYYERSCGNVNQWKGFFATSVGWSGFTSTSDFFGSFANGSLHTEYSGTSISVRFSLSWQHFRHYCKKVSEKICLGGAKNKKVIKYK